MLQTLVVVASLAIAIIYLVRLCIKRLCENEGCGSCPLGSQCKNKKIKSK
jgi:hypothetical protein